MNKYDDMYDNGSGYHRRLFLWFIAFVMALFFFNEREGGLFVANGYEDPTISDYQLIQEQLGTNVITDLYALDAENK